MKDYRVGLYAKSSVSKKHGTTGSRRWKKQAFACISTCLLPGMLVGCGAFNGQSNTVGAGGNAAASVKELSANINNGTFSMFFNLNDKHTFDPDIFSYEMYLDGMGIFEGLVRMGPHNTVVPGMAVKWSTSNNGLVWTFKLRSAKFSNGDPVTANDFVYSIQRAVNPNTAVQEQASPVPVSFIPIKNIQAVRQGQLPLSSLGVKAVNASTLQITLQAKDPNFLKDLTLPQNAWIVPVDEKVVSNMSPSDWATPSKIVSNGPYMVQSYALGTSVTLVPNPYYYSKVNLRKINILYTTADQLLPFENGSFDMAELLPTDIAAVEHNPTLKSELHWFPATAQYSLEVLNSANPLLRDNEDIRKAFEMAINKQVIVQDVLKGAGVPAYEYFSPEWLDPWIKQYGIPYNPTEAKLLLKKAGFSDISKFPTVILLTTGVDPVAQAIQQMWEQNLGVKVELESDEWGQFVTSLQQQLPANEVGFYVWSTNASYPNLMLPQSVNEWLGLNTSAIRGFASPSGYQQWESVSNNKSIPAAQQINEENSILWNSLPNDVKEYIDLGIEAYKTGNTKLAEQFYAERAQRVYDIPVYTPLNPVLIRSDVKGYNPDDFLDITPPYWLNDITLSK